MKNEKPKQYCTKADLMAELKLYHKTGVMSEELGNMFLAIATKFSNHSNWMRYPQAVKDDFVGDAVLRMVLQIDKFDVDHPKANPFGYFTQLVYHSFIMSVKKQYYKPINIQRKLCGQFIEEIECSDCMDSESFLKSVLRDRVNELG